MLLFRDSFSTVKPAKPLIGAVLTAEGTAYGTVSDFEGKFDLSLPEGNYDIICRYISFENYRISDLNIASGKAMHFNIEMSPETQELEEVVVTAAKVRNTEAAVMTIRRKSPKLLDALSAQSFSRSGDGAAAEAIKRIPGVSVEGGKYVYVRGLGDRYTQVIMNDLQIPGLDPDRNTVPMDIFPTNIIDNLTVYKSYSPDLTAEFTGGIVNINTVDFPDHKTFAVKAGTKVNTETSFNKDYISYKGGKLDFLGMDDGTRELPFTESTTLPDPVMADSRLTELTKSFNSELGVQKMTAYPGANLSISYGDQHTTDHLKIGYILGASYKNTRQLYENVAFGEYLKNVDRDVNSLVVDRLSEGTLSQAGAFWSALGSLTFKWANNKVGLNLFTMQDGQSRSAVITQKEYEQNPANHRKNRTGIYRARTSSCRAFFEARVWYRSNERSTRF